MSEKTRTRKKAKSPKPTTPLVMIKIGTLLCRRTGLPIKPVLVGPHTHCLLRDRRRAALFLSRTRRLGAKLVPLQGKPLVFHPRHASQVLQTRFPCLKPGNYRVFSLIQSSTTTSAHLGHINRFSIYIDIRIIYSSTEYILQGRYIPTPTLPSTRYHAAEYEPCYLHDLQFSRTYLVFPTVLLRGTTVNRAKYC